MLVKLGGEGLVCEDDSRSLFSKDLWDVKLEFAILALAKAPA
jgi:hypothetical protein